MKTTDQERTEIYQRFNKKVLNYIWGKVNNRTLAEDLCSDVFMKVYEKLESFDETKASLSTWIFTIARNTLIDYYRTRRVHEEIPEELAEESTVEDHLLNQEALESLADALERLDERERDLIVLRYASKLTLKEISERMNLSYAYIKILHNKALSEMKNFLENV